MLSDLGMYSSNVYSTIFDQTKRSLSLMAERLFGCESSCRCLKLIL